MKKKLMNYFCKILYCRKRNQYRFLRNMYTFVLSLCFLFFQISSIGRMMMTIVVLCVCVRQSLEPQMATFFYSFQRCCTIQKCLLQKSPPYIHLSILPSLLIPFHIYSLRRHILAAATATHG